jgi:hypothetical protein
MLPVIFDTAPLTGGAWNSTAQMSSVISSTTILFIVICMAAAIGLAVVISSLQRFKRFMELLNKAVASLRYTIYGGGISLVGYFLYLCLSMLKNATTGIDPVWYAYGIGAYIGFTVLGWIGTKVVARVKDLHGQYKISKQSLVTMIPGNDAK